TGYEATMASDPLIVPPRFTAEGPNRYSARESALRRILSNRLDRDLPKEMSEKDVTLPQSFGNIKTLLVSQLTGEGGWLRASLNLSPQKAAQVEAPANHFAKSHSSR
ncbi:MAG: hypothetical protein N2C12_19135, partial [Planctomycetales bacterium]